jgi:hypothetical protein
MHAFDGFACHNWPLNRHVGPGCQREQMHEQSWPFIGTEALTDGSVTRRSLRSHHTTVYRNVYVPKGHDLTAATRAVAAWLWSERTATAAGLSAAALHGTRWIDPTLPAELYRRNG